MRIRFPLLIIITLTIILLTLAIGLRVQTHLKAKTTAVIEAGGMHRCLPEAEVDLLIRPEDVAAFGDVIVTTPEHSLKEDRTSFLGWEDAREIGIGLVSPIPGEYAADIISHVYTFSSPERAQAVLATWSGPDKELMGENGMPLLDERLVQLLNQCSSKWMVRYTIDSDGLPIYAALLQVGPYVADIYITAVAFRFVDEISYESSASAEERNRAYVELIQRKMEKGMTFQQLVNTEKAHTFGGRLLNHVLRRVFERGEN